MLACLISHTFPKDIDLINCRNESLVHNTCKMHQKVDANKLQKQMLQKWPESATC